MNNIKGPYILITPGVPDSIYKGLNGGIKILHQASNSAEGKKDFISGCIAAVEEWPLPDEFMMNLSEKTVIIWNPEGQKLTTHKKRQLILGELGSDDAQNSLILSLFSKNIYQKALISREKVLLTSEREINKQLLKVGVSLSAERNNDKLLDQIVLQIRQLTKSDAGSLYLLVEDEESVRMNLTVFLEDEGFVVHAANTAEDALDILSTEKIDAGIIDLRLSGMDGNTLILKAHELQPDMKFVIHTGSMEYMLPRKLLNIGIGPQQVFVKPLLDMNLLVRAIKNLTGKKTVQP